MEAQEQHHSASLAPAETDSAGDSMMWGEAPALLTHSFRLALGSHSQPRRPLRGSHWSGLEVLEVVPGSQPGRDTKPMKTDAREAALKCPPPHFSHLFRAPGWIGGLRY